MSKTAKEIVRNFYLSKILTDETVVEKYIHPDAVLIWNSAAGLSIMHYDEIGAFFTEVGKTYSDLRLEVSHLLSDGNFVTIRYKSYISTIENPDEELGIAHFMSIWEVKDGKMFRGHTVSQPVSINDDTSESYHKVKV